MKRIGIIGGGMAGLTAAYELLDEPAEVTVFEAQPEAGGKVKTERADGYLIEKGPNTLQSASPAMQQIIDELNLEREITAASEEAGKRFVVRGGSPLPLPTSLGDFLSTPLLSWRAKLRLLKEPFVSTPPTRDTESIADFVERRLGSEVLAYAVNPFVAGIYAGDPGQLSLRHTFPRLEALERQHGSLLVGHVKKMMQGSRRSASSPKRRLFSFKGGLQALPNALAQKLEDRIHFDTEVHDLRRTAEGWQLSTAGAEAQVFDAVIFAAPLYRLQAMQFDSPVDLDPLSDVPYPPVTVLALGFHRDDVAHPLDGFGMLVPEAEEEFSILGTLFISSLFDGRAPDDHVLLSTFVGGMRRPELALAPTDAVVETALSDLRTLLGVSAAPSFVRRIRWEHAIPQYHLHYQRVQDTINQLETACDGLFLAGNFRSGVSVGDTMTSGREAAQSVSRFVSK